MAKENAHITYDCDKDHFRFRLASPLSVCWQITLNCNLKCKFCLSDSRPNGFEGLPTAGALDIISCLADAGIKRIDFSGGEPLLRPDLSDLLIFSKKQGINPVVTTNGVMMTAGDIDLLKETASVIKVSIDGPKALHNSLRGADVYDQTLANVRKLVAAGCRVRINTILFKRNMKYCENLLKLSGELGAFSHSFIPVLPVGRGALYRNEMLDDRRISELRRDILGYNSAKGNDLNVRVRDYKDFNGAMVIISARGEILGQSDIKKPPRIMGHIMTDDIRTVFNSPAYDHHAHFTRYAKNID